MKRTESTQEALTLDWKNVERLSSALADKISAAGFVPDHLFGVAVGGLVPLVLVARKLHTQNVMTVAAHSYDERTNIQGEFVITHLPEVDLRGASILLLDEIADSGTTLARVAEELKRTCHPASLKTATLAVNTLHCKVRPDFSVLDVETWVSFPWDK